MAIKAKNTITLVRTDDGLPAYVHNAWANSQDGTVDFTTVYPGENAFLDSEREITNGNIPNPEFISPYWLDLTPLIDEHGIDKEYTISFDLASKDTTNSNSIRFYSYPGSPLPGKYLFPLQTYTVTTEYQRFSLTFKPTLNDPNSTQSRIAFYGNYGSGNVPIIRKVKFELGKNPDPIYTPSPSDDPIGAYPKYMGTCSNHSETAPTDPNAYHWEVDPTYLKYVTDGKVDQGNFDEGLENIYDVLGSKTDAEDFKNLQEQAKALQDSYESFTSDGGQYEKDLANLEARATELYLELGDKLLGLAFINTWFKVGEEGLVIGSDSSSVKMLLSNNQLSFVDAGQTVAYFTSQSFYINRGVIALSFQVGSHKITKIDNDYTVFQWVG